MTNDVSDERLAEYASDNSSLYDHHEFPLPQIEDIRSMARELLSRRSTDGEAVQCCMCGKKGLSTVEGDGGTECQLEDGRWTCSLLCWDKAGGDGPDIPAPIEPVAVTDEMVERALDAVVVRVATVDDYISFNAADAENFGVLEDGEKFHALDIIRIDQMRECSAVIMRAALTAALTGASS